MIGPSLPPHLQRKKKESLPNDSEETGKTETVSSSPKPAITGPQLPPHLLAAHEAKRKRKRDEESATDKRDETSYGPAPPPKRQADAKTPPTLPMSPTESNSDDDSNSDIGPSLSDMMTPAESVEYARQQAVERLSRTLPKPNTSAPKEPKLQRDSWMLAPPSRAEWLGTLDASKLKARKFNQSKSGTNTQDKSVDHTIWTESPLERAQRLEDEALGRHRPKPVVTEDEKMTELVERDRRIKEYNAQTRGPSLMEKHSASRKPEEDDPSKRPFDYQKDIAGGGTLGFKERNAVINRAKDLDSKYSGGTYL